MKPMLLRSVRSCQAQKHSRRAVYIAASDLRRTVDKAPERMAEIPDYSSWTNEQLVARVTALEKELRSKNESFRRPGSALDGAHTKKPKQKREFDPSRYNTRPIALKLAYMGQNYNGFEYHANNDTPLPTIEEELWKALTKTKLIFPTDTTQITWDGCGYSKCGRTDKGVSAFGQVIGLTVRSNRPMTASSEEKTTDFDPVTNELPYTRILNRVLPDDIRILGWCPAPTAEFSARFSCQERQYKYFFTQPAFVPLPGVRGVIRGQDGRERRDGWLDIEAMRKAASYFIGLHDFRNFCKIDAGKQITDFRRRINHASIEEAESCRGMINFVKREDASLTAGETAKVYSFNVHGSAFLWHQVRHMAAILFLVGQGFEDPSIVQELLDFERTPGRPQYQLAEDLPLVLWDCIFSSDHEGKDLPWILPDDQREPIGGKQSSLTGDGRYGPGGINEVLWANWRRKKVDEVLAGSLLDAVAGQKSNYAAKTNGFHNDPREPGVSQSARVFEGGNIPRLKGEYTPIMRRERIGPPDELNARYKGRKGTYVPKALREPSNGN